MKVTALWVYPIKSLRGIALQEAELGPQGIKYDRSFMLCRINKDGALQKIQLSDCPALSLFEPQMRDGAIHVRYHIPNEPLVPHDPKQDVTLKVPLEPDTAQLDRGELNVHQSLVSAYGMGGKYDEWFSACLGFPTRLFYIGDQRRPILGTFSPLVAAQKQQQEQHQKSWVSSLASYVTGGNSTPTNRPADWIRFSDCAPYLVATEASLANVRSRLTSPVDIVKFRPNIVLDGEGEFDEDFWAELSIHGMHTLTLSKMCGRCSSLNVDYDTGRPGVGESGTVLKKLMTDRRVDPGNKYSPVFGRYAFLSDEAMTRLHGGDDDASLRIKVGDDVEVTRRNESRPEWDWPIRDKSAARYYTASPQTA